jgi:hypothetical protein
MGVMPRLCLLSVALVGCAARPLDLPLEAAPDLAQPTDLGAARPVDLAAPADLGVAPDLAHADDLGRAADLEPPADLSPTCNADAFPCPVWGRLYGDPGYQTLAALGSDGENAVIGFVVSTGTLQLPGVAQAGTGSFVAEIDPRGQALWQLPLGGASIADVAADAAGGVYVAASLTGSITLGTSTLTSAGDSDLLLLKLDATGNVSWSRQYGDAGRQRAESLAAVPGGGVVLSGRFGGTLDFGGGVMLQSDGTVPHLDVHAGNDFVARFDGDGNLLWARQTHGDWAVINDVAVAAGGNIFAVGALLGPGDPGGGSVTSTGDAPEHDLLVLSPGGDVVSAQLLGTNGYYAPSVAASGDGAVGLFSPTTADRGWDQVLRWSASGERLSTSTVGATPSSFAQIAAATDGRLAIATIHGWNSVQTGVVLGLAGTEMPSLLLLDDSANVIAQRALAPKDTTAKLWVTFTPRGALWLGGFTFGEAIDVGLGPLSPTPADDDVFLAYFAAPQ